MGISWENGFSTQQSHCPHRQATMSSWGPPPPPSKRPKKLPEAPKVEDDMDAGVRFGGGGLKDDEYWVGTSYFSSYFLSAWTSPRRFGRMYPVGRPSLQIPSSPAKLGIDDGLTISGIKKRWYNVEDNWSCIFVNSPLLKLFNLSP